MGKLPERILQRAKKHKIPVWLVAGKAKDKERLLAAGFTKAVGITPEGMDMDEAMNPDVAKDNIRRWAETVKQ